MDEQAGFWSSTYRLCVAKGLRQARVPPGTRKVWVVYSPQDPRQFVWGITRESAEAEYRRRAFWPHGRKRLELEPDRAARANTLGWAFAEIAKAYGHSVTGHVGRRVHLTRRPVEERKN